MRKKVDKPFKERIKEFSVVTGSAMYGPDDMGYTPFTQVQEDHLNKRFKSIVDLLAKATERIKKLEDKLSEEVHASQEIHIDFIDEETLDNRIKGLQMNEKINKERYW